MKEFEAIDLVLAFPHLKAQPFASCLHCGTMVMLSHDHPEDYDTRELDESRALAIGESMADCRVCHCAWSMEFRGYLILGIP